MRAYLEQACRAMLDSLDFCPRDLPGFRALAAKVITARVASTLDRATEASPPWLALPILTCEALGSTDRLPAACHVAAAWELGNLAAGCLDAWQDEDTEDAVWQWAGPGQAVNLAVGLIGLSFAALSGLATNELLPVAVALTVKGGFERTLVTMAAGQHADLADDLALGEYEDVARAKTGSVFRLGGWAGAVVAEAAPDTAERYGIFGEELGLLIQAWNDLYGLQGALGKQDVGHRRTLPVLAALEIGDDGTPAGELARSPQGQSGQIYALMQAGILHEHAAAALDRCPAAGRLSLFLDAYSVERLVLGSQKQSG